MTLHAFLADATFADWFWLATMYAGLRLTFS